MRMTRLRWLSYPVAVALGIAIMGFAVATAAQQAKPPTPTPPPTLPRRAGAVMSAPAAIPPSSSSNGAGGAGGGGDAPKVKVERGAGGKKIYRITEDIRIEGKIQKPEAFFFYQKSSINYDWQELKQDFLPRILESVNGSPF
jgi:hypothetical protein